MLTGLNSGARHGHFFVAQSKQPGARRVAQSRVQLHLGGIGFRDAGLRQLRDFVGEGELRIVVGIGRTRVAPRINRVVFSLRPFAINIPPQDVGFDQIAERMLGPRGFQLARKRDGLVRLSQVHQVDGLFRLGRNFQF